MRPQIIGLMGKKGSGKDAAAKLITNLVYPLATAKVSFAAPIKDFCAEIFGWDRAKLDDDGSYKEMLDPNWTRPCSRCNGSGLESEGTECILCEGTREGRPLRPREALQKLGTEFGRACHPDVWVRYALRQADATLRGSSVREIDGRGHGVDYQVQRTAALVLITDVRFKNEARAIKAAGGLVVRLLRGQSGMDTHPSEIEMDDDEMKRSGTPFCDCSITNEGTMSELRADLRLWLSHKGFSCGT